jgi:hypothetical protein
MRLDRRFLALVLAAPLLSVLPTAPAMSRATTEESTSGAPVLVHVIRETPTGELGLARPATLAWSPTLHTLLVGAGRRVLRLAPDGRAAGKARISRAPMTATLAVAPHGGATSFVAGADLVTYTAAALRRPRPAGRRTPLDLPVRDVRGAAYDARGILVVLDGSSLVHRGRHGRVVRTTLQSLAGHHLVGLTRWPGRDVLFTYDRDTRMLVGVGRDGGVVRRFDLRRVGVRAVTGLAIAPSADRTDHRSTMSLYLTDSGGGRGTGRLVEASLAAEVPAAVTSVSASLVHTVQTSTYSPPSPDPSGIGYLPDLDRFVIADGEVDEMSIFAGVNLYEITRTGAQTRNGVSLPWSNEPTGSGYNPANHHLLVSDDSKREVFDIAAGPDTRYGSSDDTITHFDTLGVGNGDTEDVTWDPVTGSVWTIDGVNAQVYRYRPGPDGVFGTADDLHSNFDVGAYGAQDPEGIVYDPARDTLFVLDDISDTIYELDRAGALLNTISTLAANTRAAAGIAVAPASNNSGVRNYYVVDRGIDNDNHPTENDGLLYELAATLPPTGSGTNQPPVASAGPDLTVTLPASATLDGTVTDDGRPNPPGATTVTWSKVSGFGDVVFANPNAVDTSASFSADGTYVLRLSASDGQTTGADDVVVTVRPSGGGGVTTVETLVQAGSDDAEQAPGGGVSLTSTDLELVTDGTKVQRVGVRFANLQVPGGATVTRAWIQFQTDEVSTDTAALTLRAEASDNTPTYVGTTNNVSNRAVTTASVAWNPPSWPAAFDRGPAQQTPDISSLVQTVVSRSGWAQGNALAVQITGTGRRTAESFEGNFAPVLHVEYTSGAPGSNQPPLVSAGPDRNVTLPATAGLDGTVTDDGLPSPPAATTVAWSTVSGPGTVTFTDPNAVDTTASFSSAGTYLLRLTATDSALTGSDEMTVVVSASGGGTTTVETSVASGSDDAEQGTTSVSLDSSDLELVTDGTKVQTVGVRFAHVQVPPGASVTRAWIQFQTDEVSTDAATLTLRAEAADSAPTYQATSSNITSRALISASVAWSPPVWNVVGARTVAQQTPDIATLVQAVVARPGWAQGNALAVQIRGTGRRTAEAFEGTFAPVLHIEFSS